MSDTIQNWHEQNTRYLSAALEWLRLKLTTLIATGPGKDKGLAHNTAQEQAINKAFAAMAALETAELSPAIVIIGRRFSLSAFERNLLLLCAAMELDTGIPALCAQAQDDPGKPFPTFALAMLLFEDSSWDAIAPQRPLRNWRLIEVARLPGQPLLTCPLRGDERIINYIKGLNYLDERIERVSSPFGADGGQDALPASQEDTVSEIVASLNRTVGRRLSSAVQLVGPDTMSKQQVAQRTAAILNLHLINLPIELLPSQASELEEFSRLWQRESLLLPLAGYIDTHQTDGVVKPDGGLQAGGFALQRFLSLSQGIFFIAVREIRPDLHSTSFTAEIKKPTSAEQLHEWNSLLADRANGSPGLLAGQFNLNLASIRKIAGPLQDDDQSKEAFHQKLWKSCLVHTSPQLDTLVQKIELKATWDDIVLPELSVNQLRQIASQVRYRSQVYDEWGFRNKMNRGLGINALFTGESGTGKTMAAEVLANDLNLHLYRIDLSGVVSKYIGETEKNLKRVFDAAEDGGAILFFDEADALFGKRSEVKDSHDRYANIEINYLLQRMESFNGLAILATNKKGAMDESFTRRLRFIIHFPFPGMRERKVIAKKIFPKGVPVSGLDYDRLAALNLTGGSFYNIAVNAAFDAAEKGSPVTMPLILSAAKAEFQKIERPVKESDFVWNE